MDSDSEYSEIAQNTHFNSDANFNHFVSKHIENRVFGISN